MLVLTPRFPYPVVGGDRLRIYFVCKYLAKKYEITLLSLCESQEEMDFIVPSDGVFARVERVFLSIFRSRLNCSAAVFSGLSLQIAYYRSAQFKAAAKRLAKENELVLAHLVRTGAYVLGLDLQGKTTILEMTDAISMNYDRVKRLGQVTGLRNIIYSLEQKRLKKIELEMAGQFDVTMLVSEVDRQYLISEQAELERNVIVCSNGVDTQDLAFDYVPDGRTMVFIGNMTSLQNLDAVNWFVSDVMPKLLSEGDYHLKIVGRIRELDKKLLVKFKNVTVTGEVSSVAQAVRGATIGICSVRMAAGIQNKILECMALGIPVVATRIGYEGLSAIEGEDLLVADNSHDYAQMILSIFQSADLRNRLSIGGRRYVETHHSWDAMFVPLEKALSESSGR